MKKPYIIITLLLILTITLSLGKAFMSNMLSTSGIFVSRAEQKINSYKTQSVILSEELLAASSLTNIAQKANKSGFISDNTLMVLGASSPLAKR